MNHVLEPLEKAKKTTAHPPWLVCKRCGLVALKNQATAKALKAPCPGKEDQP